MGREGESAEAPVGNIRKLDLLLWYDCREAEMSPGFTFSFQTDLFQTLKAAWLQSGCLLFYFPLISEYFRVLKLTFMALPVISQMTLPSSFISHVSSQLLMC